MFNFIKKYFDYNQKELNRIGKIVEEINRFEDKARDLKDSQFSEETDKLKKQVAGDSQKLEAILPWSFALVREAARRILGERHFDVQLVAGVALHEGKVAEQKTGEGKTLSATTAMYLNCLTGKGVHLVTVNDYLARRDCGWMGQIFHFLGVKTAAIISEKSFIYDPNFNDSETHDRRLSHLWPISRKEAYQADITYGINSEFGFDYLRDNMALNKDDLVQRGFNYAIIDEADSVLIDEARTPHIISAPYDEEVTKYYQYANLVKKLTEKTDYVIDEKSRTANLTEKGVLAIESALGVENIYEKDFDTLFHVEAALKAAALFKKDKDYIVKDGEVIIVDEFTGRLLYGRRFSEGIHQAIEAKENVSIQKESKTLATVSLQNYFRAYKKLAGMTGTAATEAEELHKIYKVNTLVVLTHRPMIRKNHPDMIYKTEKGKFDAVVEEIAQSYKTGRPVLVGTTSIEKNELLSHLLKIKGIPHELLNAKNHEREAEIIAKAGEKQAVTVATNMAGRGVDIILGGEVVDDKKKDWQKKHDEIVSLGGLYVIGTERHESRRIDNQLRGRSGRQGDPGESRFFVSLSDDLMRIFGGEQISKLMTFFNFPEDQPLTHSMVSKAIEQAQVKVEGYNFDIRKHLVDYDDVLNKQREIVYTLRRKILTLPEENKEEFRKTVFDIFNEEAEQLVNQHFFQQGAVPDEIKDKFVKETNLILPFDRKETEKLIKENNIEKLTIYIKEKIGNEFKYREKKIGSNIWLDVTKMIFLSTVDKYWTEHLTAIDDLREGIGLRGYAQLDPLVEYKNEAYSMFERLMGDINFEATRRLFKVQVEAVEPVRVKKEENIVFKSASSIDPYTQSPAKPQQFTTSQPEQVTPQVTVKEESSPDQIGGFKIIPPGASQKKPGRNEPCWCGATDSKTGKPIKYKKCHYPN